MHTPVNQRQEQQGKRLAALRRVTILNGRSRVGLNCWSHKISAVPEKKSIISTYAFMGLKAHCAATAC
jgi:hypothetical protein